MRPAVLLSYHFWKQRDLGALLSQFPERPVVFADSGAYSAASVGAEIVLSEYLAWLDRWNEWIDVICTLDVIGSGPGTYANTELLREALDTPGRVGRLLPAFHTGEDWDWLRRYCEEFAYVGLGGMVPWSMQPKVVTRWLTECFIIGREYGTVFHGLGQTNLRTLAALPFYSVDSSSWVSAERFGTFTLWDPARSTFVTIHPAREPARAYQLGHLFRAVGLDPAEVTDPLFGRPKISTGDDRTAQSQAEQRAGRAASLRAWLQMQEWWATRHGAVKVDGLPDGPMLFFVCLDERQLRTVLEVTTAPAPVDA